MRRNSVGGLLAALGAVAVVTSPAAAASPVDDAWPYGTLLQLPGFSVGGQVTPVDGIPFLSQGVLPWSVPDYGGGYSTDFIGFQVPFVGYLIHQEAFDSTVPFPSDGTTWDGFSFGPVSNFLIIDPVAGIGDQFIFFGIQNTFISDAAGLQDVLTVFGQDFTLLDLPAVL